MFKQQVSPRTFHPYQTTVVPRSEHQYTSATQHRTKYPWVEDINTPVYQVTGTESSTSENAYQMPQYYNESPSAHGPSSPVYQTPYSTGTWHSYKRGEKLPVLPSNTYTFPQCSSAFSLPVHEIDNHTLRRTPQPPMPSVSPEVPIIGACGGHCPGFEYVCYYILQVIFVVGILTGISLSIAGIVLRRTNRNGDLGVLVYIEVEEVNSAWDFWTRCRLRGQLEALIHCFPYLAKFGCLMSCVCGVLLGVQCCVRSEIKQRKVRANANIPMQSIQEAPAQACPLLTLPRGQIYRPTVADVSPGEEETGVPWWRRAETD